MTSREILDLPLEGNISNNWIGNNTVRGFLTCLLYTLWDEADCFRGKRPFGDGDWQFALAETLIKGGALPGTIDDEECEIDFNVTQFDKMVKDAIIEMCAK